MLRSASKVSGMRASEGDNAGARGKASCLLARQPGAEHQDDFLNLLRRNKYNLYAGLEYPWPKQATTEGSSVTSQYSRSERVNPKYHAFFSVFLEAIREHAGCRPLRAHTPLGKANCQPPSRSGPEWQELQHLPEPSDHIYGKRTPG